MRVNTVLIAAAAVVAAVVGLTLLNSRPTQAADPPKPTAESGRYQLVTDRDGKPGYLFDTETGRVWQPYFSEKVGEWAEHIKPPKAK
jgi:hypothetical protein